MRCGILARAAAASMNLKEHTRSLMLPGPILPSAKHPHLMCDGVCIPKKMCNNEIHSTQMKRILLTSLASLLVMSSLGHVFAAAFCPRSMGGGCCLAKTDRTHGSSIHKHRAAHCSAMSAAATDVGSMDRMPLHEMAVGD